MTMQLQSPATVCQSLLAHAASQPDKVALICGERSLTYAELADRTATAAAALQARGIAAGGRICVETDDPLDHVIGILAAMAARLIPVPLPPNASASYGNTVADSEPALVLISTADAARETLRGKVPAVPVAELTAGEGDRQCLAFHPGAEELVMFYYTSGTTSGVGKGVMQSFRALYNTVRYITRIMRINGEIREVIASPTETVFWFGRVRVILHNGGTAILNDGPLTAIQVMRLVTRFEANALSGDTPIFIMLLRHLESRLRATGPQIRWVKVASQSMAVEDKQLLDSLFPNGRVVMNYGLTEAMRCCILPFREFPDKLASVGRPCDTVEARIVDKDDNAQPSGTVGEIQVRGGNLAVGYWRKDELWHERTKSGWYATGDIGFIDADGFVYVQGRKDDAVNVGGRTIAPAEVEALVDPLIKHRNFAICGVADPDGLLGDVLCLCVEKEWQEPVAWSEFRRQLAAKIPPALVPKLACVLPELPRTSNGKIQRNKLRPSIEAGKAQSL
jgi:long-chain acyl-CoA synthetase